MKVSLLLIIITFLGIENLKSQKSVLIDSVRCKNNPDQYYALYLPENYEENVNTPVLFFFEPGARANLPISKYKCLADKYNIVLACSWNSRNGPASENYKAANAIIRDVILYNSIDTSAIFLSGFSGGARFSYYYSLKNYSIKGVISCGAGLPEQMKSFHPAHFNYCPIIGYEDFNFYELYKLKKLYYSKNIPIPFIVFNGAHVWPPVKDFERALIFQLGILGKSNIDKLSFITNEKLILQETYKANNLIDRLWIFENIKYFSDMQEDQTAFLDSIQQLKKFKPFKKQNHSFVKALQLEDSLQKELAEASNAIYLTTFNIYDNHKSKVWWQKKIKYIRKLIYSSDNSRQLLGKRLLNLIRVLMWEGNRTLIKEGYFQAALESAEILLLIDNNSVWYLLLKAEALAALKKDDEAKKLIENLELNNSDDIDYWKNNKYLYKFFDNTYPKN